MILVAMAAAVTIMIVVAAIVSVKKAAVAMIMDCVATKGSKEFYPRKFSLLPFPLSPPLCL